MMMVGIVLMTSFVSGIELNIVGGGSKIPFAEEATSVKGVKASGLCAGKVCSNNIFACAPGCSCLAGLCYGNCCRD